MSRSLIIMMIQASTLIGAFPLKNNWMVALALAKGKKQYDKRQSLREKDDKRAMDRAMKF